MGIDHQTSGYWDYDADKYVALDERFPTCPAHTNGYCTRISNKIEKAAAVPTSSSSSSSSSSVTSEVPKITPSAIEVVIPTSPHTPTSSVIIEATKPIAAELRFNVVCKHPIGSGCGDIVQQFRDRKDARAFAIKCVEDQFTKFEMGLVKDENLLSFWIQPIRSDASVKVHLSSLEEVLWPAAAQSLDVSSISSFCVCSKMPSSLGKRCHFHSGEFTRPQPNACARFANYKSRFDADVAYIIQNHRSVADMFRQRDRFEHITQQLIHFLHNENLIDVEKSEFKSTVIEVIDEISNAANTLLQSLKMI